METRRGAMSHRNARVNHVAANAYHPHLPVPKRGKAGGRGGESVRLAEMDATRPVESGAQCCEVVCEERVLEKPARGRVVEKPAEW